MELEFIHIAAILLFALKIASGIWLRKKGRPFPTALLNLHKFIALGLIALLAMIVRRLSLVTGVETLALVLIVVNALFFLVAIITGGLLSLEKPAAAPVKMVHQWIPVFTALTILLFFYLLLQ